MRITVEILRDHEGLKKGQKRNLQPHIATSLIKRGIAKSVGVTKRPNATKAVQRLEAVKVEIEKIELIKGRSAASITAAFPIYNNSQIAFLQLDSLCAQKDAPDWELIVCEEDSDNYLGIDTLKKYMARLKKAGCVRILFVKLDKWVPLGQKWLIIRDHMNKKSVGMMLCAADNYSPSNRIKESFEALEDGYEWKQNTSGAFYSIKDHKAGIMNCKENGPGLFMCVAKKALDRIIRTDFPKSGVDSWMLQNALPEKIKNDGKTRGVHTDGYNTISHHRKMLYCREEAAGMFSKADAQKVFLQIPKATRTKIEKLPDHKSKK